MDERLKHRLTGAMVLIALGVIFIPMVLDGPDEATRKVEVELPPKPEYPFPSRVVPLPPKTASAEVSAQASVSRAAPPDAGIGTTAAAGTGAQPAADKPVATPPRHQSVAAQFASAASKPAPKPEDTSSAAVQPSAAPAVSASPPAATTAPDSGADAAAAPRKKEKSTPTAWVVQVGSFGNEANANRLRAELRQAGFAAFVETEGEGHSKAYKVRIGPETERATAEALKARLQRERKLTGQVRPYP